MLLQRSNLGERSVEQLTEDVSINPRRSNDQDSSLSCMFYFFASQMKRNIQAPDPDLVQRKRVPDQPAHRLDTLLSRIEMHASYSPHVTMFEKYPVAIPEASGRRKSESYSPPELVHDTVLLMQFRTKRSREEWIATKEWQEFMEKTESEQVFRRMPHVRCARSIRGLMDPVDILTA